MTAGLSPSVRIAPSLTRRPQWRSLLRHHGDIGRQHLRELFNDQPGRGEFFVAEAAGLYLDYSKQRVTVETMRLLHELARACDLPGRIEAMFRGDPINSSEQRAVLHTALRAPAGTRVDADGSDVVPGVHAVLERMAVFCECVRSGAWTGHGGQRIRTVVNIGIGGSDLGPSMVVEALRHYRQRDMDFRFVSSLDASDLIETLRDLDPAETLFVVSSKSFTTPETLANAKAARNWCLQALGETAVAKHFVAVSANTAAAIGFGIAAEGVFGLWDWVGGRYSLASSVGLSTMLAVGPKNFRSMLAGMHTMDAHFRSAPLPQNLPALMGLLAIWNSNFLGAATVAILPYEHSLKRFPAYVQQLAMESNGKQVTLDGVRVDYPTGPVYWGAAGSNAQHSFFQLLHQGTQLIPSDFIGACQPLDAHDDQHDLLLANMFAQAEALAFGSAAGETKAGGTPATLTPQRRFEGNRPSNTLLAGQLTPRALGALVALYEHSVFVQGVIWNINSFDQWGVELGKELAIRTGREIADCSDAELGHDSSTNALIRRCRRLRNARLDD